jgi:glyoxylase-like metal-dependent hydrolase (beta-lactamase superfamily II)
MNNLFKASAALMTLMALNTGVLAATAPAMADPNAPKVNYQAGTLPQKWLTGGPECATFRDDFQVQKYNDNFYILRESGCVHTEKPFLYLLFGEDKAILFDTGAGKDTDPTTGRVPNVVGAVNRVIAQWSQQHQRKSIPLVVAHLHSHFDHIWGDPQFIQRPDTTFIKPGDVDTLKTAFHIQRWPDDIGTFDLGGRVLDVIPVPGHDETSIAVYDRATGVLLTGDMLYPGRLYVNENNPDIMQASVQRLVDFTRSRLVVHILGTHVEQRAPYYDYPRGVHYAPDEMPLQLGRGDLLELLDATKLRITKDNKPQITQKAYRNFTLCGVYPQCEPVNAESRTRLVNDQAK